MKTTINEMAAADVLIANWTGLNAIELWQAGRLTDETLKRWATDSANERPELFDAADLTGSMARFDSYVSAFVSLVKNH